MKILKTMPEPAPRAKKEGLRTHQIRVLRVIGAAKTGALSRAKIAERANISPTVVSRALGYEDKEKREQFEENDPTGGFPSLLTLKLVKEVKMALDGGKTEIGHVLTPKGRKALAEVADVQLPPPRD